MGSENLPPVVADCKIEALSREGKTHFRVLFFDLYGDCVGKILIPGDHFRKIAETFSTLPEYKFLDP